jgi:hypothetical protein
MVVGIQAHCDCDGGVPGPVDDGMFVGPSFGHMTGVQHPVINRVFKNAIEVLRLRNVSFLSHPEEDLCSLRSER